VLRIHIGDDRNGGSLPPITMVGSRPAAAKTVANMDVVVVFPCVPAMAKPYFIRISSASISALGMTGTPWDIAALISVLWSGTAVLLTTTSA